MTTLGYTIFYVADVESTVAFYEAAFGFKRRFVTPENDYGELETGDTTLSFVSHELANRNLDAAGGFAPITADGQPVGASVTLVTEDVPAALTAAEEAGALRYTDPTEKPWGQTVAYVRDPNGILLELGTPVSGA